MRRVILLACAAVLFVSYTGCCKDKQYARRYSPTYYDTAPCGCDGAAGPIDGVVVPGPIMGGPVMGGPVVSGPMGATPQAVGGMPGPVGRTISSTPIQPSAGY
jgi:hypothetical protein